MPTALPALLRRIAGPKQRRHSNYRTSHGEMLEVRVLPSAVTAVSRGTLTVTGDVDGSDLQIEQVSGGVKVTALNGTSLRVAGVDVVNGTETFTGVTSLNVKLGDADDSVAVMGALNLKNVSFTLGDGDNILDVGAGLNATGKFTINGGSGLDQVTLNGVVSKGATVNLGLGNDELTIHGGSFSAAVNLNTGVGADIVTIDTNAAFNNNLSVTTGEDNDSVSISNSTTKKLTINTGDDDDGVTLDTVTVNGLMSVNTSAGADDLSLLGVNVTANGTNSLNVGTGADDVVIERSVFAGNLNIDLGTGIVNTLKIDDTDFQNNFSLVANGSVDSTTGIGDLISVETDTALTGVTTFRKTAKLKVGAAADITLGVVNVASQTNFLGAVSVSGINPHARLHVAASNVTYASLPSLVKVDLI